MVLVRINLQALAANPLVAWVIVAGHYPVFSAGEHGDSAALAANLLPLFDR